MPRTRGTDQVAALRCLLAADAARFLTCERFDLVFVGDGRVDEP
jgi:hypothetical protein